MIKTKLLSRVLSLALVFLALVVVAAPVLAAAYSASFAITEDSGNAYDMLATQTDANNQWMADNGFMRADALDTRVETLGGSEKPWMVAQDRTLTATAVPADSQVNLYYTTGSTPASSMDIIPGHDGYITIPDDATIELGDTFEIEQSGYINTDAGADKNLVYKEDAFRTYVSAEDEITSALIHRGAFPTVATTNGGNNAVNGLNHTVNLPAGVVAGDLLLVFFGTDGTPAIAFPGGWTNLFQKDTFGAPDARGGAWYKVASASEDDPFTVTTDAAEMTAYTIYRITGYSEVPENGVATNGNSANPDPPNLVPSWGARNTLWFAMELNDDNVTVNAYPANYGNGLNNVAANAEGVAIGSARRELNAVSDDPGVFTLSAGQQWMSNTIAICPADLDVTATSIDSGEYTINTKAGTTSNLAEGTLLYFPDATNKGIDCGDIYDASAKLWISFWFKLDEDYEAGADDNMYLFNKYSGTTTFNLYLRSFNGKLYFNNVVAGATKFAYYSTQASWNGGQWYHVIASMGQAVGGGAASNGARLRVDNGVADTNANAEAIGTTNNFYIGCYTNTSSASPFIGSICDFCVGTDDLSAAEETALYNGTPPGDETDFWYIDEGTGVNITSYGSGANAGTAGANTSWIVGTRPHTLSISIDGTMEDDARLLGASVPNTANDWLLMQNNVMPYMDYMTIDVGGAEVLKYQPDTIVDNTGEDSTADAGSTDVKIIDAALTQADDYWNGARLIITETTDGLAPEGETAVITDFLAATDELQFAALTANVDAGDTFTVDFGTVVDETGANDGRITWGVNPTGVAVALGSFTAEDQPAPGTAEDRETRDILVTPAGGDIHGDGTVTKAATLANPVRPFITMVSDNTTLTEIWVWRWLGLAFLLFVTVGAARWLRGHRGIVVIIAGVALGGLVAFDHNIFPLYLVVLSIILFAAGVVSERSPTL